MTITKIEVIDEQSTYNYDQDCYNMRIKMKSKIYIPPEEDDHDY